MSESFKRNVAEIKKKFSPLSADQKYHALIEIGRKLKPMPDSLKTPERVVRGCQSTLYLHTFFENGNIFFTASADALISAGLAALLIEAYSGEPPETILKCPPDFINDLEIAANLSPNRSNGLFHIHLRMKQEALKLAFAIN